MDSVTAWLELPGSERIYLAATCSIGRTPENRVVIPFPTVSRRHAVLHREESGAWWLVDMGSSNGTCLNDQPVQRRMPLRDGARIQIGPQTLTFRLPAPAPAPAGALQEATPVACWLLSLGATLRGAPQFLPEPKATTFEDWSGRCQRIVRSYRGAIMRGLPETFLAYWPVQGSDDRFTTVSAALRSIRAAQQATEEFRLALHFGSVTLQPGEADQQRPEGAAVIHAIQLDRLARVAAKPVLITEAAHNLLGDALPLRPLTRQELRGYRGSLQFFTLQDE